MNAKLTWTLGLLLVTGLVALAPAVAADGDSPSPPPVCSDLQPCAGLYEIVVDGPPDPPGCHPYC